MKKYLSNIVGVFSVLLMIFSVAVLLFTIVAVHTVGRDTALFGFRVYAVLSDSMDDTFSAGDMVVSRKVDPAGLQAGDIVSFRSIDPASYGQVFTHKIRATTFYEGNPAFITYGTTTGVDDSYPVPLDQVEGEFVFAIPYVGTFFQQFRTPTGYVAVVLIPFLILIGIQAVQFAGLIKLYRKEKREQDTQRIAMLEDQQRQNEEMKRELDRLRAKLAEKAGKGQE